VRLLALTGADHVAQFVAYYGSSHSRFDLLLSGPRVFA
jgi:hypothetical protein